jgi:hypothetical protein
MWFVPLRGKAADRKRGGLRYKIMTRAYNFAQSLAGAGRAQTRHLFVSSTFVEENYFALAASHKTAHFETDYDRE